jgi:hypothetical protein
VPRTHAAHLDEQHHGGEKIAKVAHRAVGRKPPGLRVAEEVHADAGVPEDDEGEQQRDLEDLWE